MGDDGSCSRSHFSLQESAFAIRLLAPFTMTDRSPSAPVAGVSQADALPPGTRLAEFEVVSLLGVGGFGMVYKAFDHSLRRTVAIKEYMPAALAARSDGCSLWVRSSVDEPDFQSGLKSFVAEARTLAQFDHPSLVKVFRFWEANHTAYMVMPLYSGMTLKQARAQMRTPPPQAWLEQVLWSVLAALRTLHESHTLHRDVSPDNIFLQDMGPAILLDLGAARHAVHDRDHQHPAVLKVNYAPLEQYDAGEGGLQAGPWSDLYSLAAVVHGCLCNATPLPSTLRSIRDRMVPFGRVAKTVKNQFGQAYSPAFVAAVAQALALRPEDRPQDIDAFLRTMELSSAPAGLEAFDFRAELGDIWVEPAGQRGPGDLVPAVELLQAQTRQLGASVPVEPMPAAAQTVSVQHAAAPSPVVRSADGAGASKKSEDTGFMDAGNTVMLNEIVDISLFATGDTLLQESVLERPAARGKREAQATSVQPQSSKPALVRQKIWTAGAAALVVAALSLGWAWQPGAVATVLADDIVVEPGAVAPGGTLAGTLETTALQEALGRPEWPALLPEPPPALVEATLAQHAVRPAALRAPKFTATASEHGSAAVVFPAPTPVSPLPAPVPKPKPEPHRPQQLCADTNFFTRSACIYRECANPALAALSICVEHRQHVQQLDNQKMSN